MIRDRGISFFVYLGILQHSFLNAWAWLWWGSGNKEWGLQRLFCHRVGTQWMHCFLERWNDLLFYTRALCWWLPLSSSQPQDTHTWCSGLTFFHIEWPWCLHMSSVAAWIPLPPPHPRHHLRHLGPSAWAFASSELSRGHLEDCR